MALKGAMNLVLAESLFALFVCVQVVCACVCVSAWESGWDPGNCPGARSAVGGSMPFKFQIPGACSPSC